MTRFLLSRLALLLPTLLGVLAVTFLMLYVAPGDPVQAMVGERADAETIARLRADRAPRPHSPRYPRRSRLHGADGTSGNAAC